MFGVKREESMRLSDLTAQIIGGAIEVYKYLVLQCVPLLPPLTNRPRLCVSVVSFLAQGTSIKCRGDAGVAG
jgi:hypothetical protein